MSEPKIKLSEAMLAGSALRPQAFYAYFERVPQGEAFEGYRNVGFPTGDFFCPIGSCALGAAYEGANPGAYVADGHVHWQMMHSKLYEQFPELGAAVRVWPCGCYPHRETLEGAICHLNSQHKWSREAIAAWVATKGY